MDLAQLLRSVFVDSPQHDPSERVRVAQRVATAAGERLDIDWNLLAALIRFRAASASSHLMVHGHRPAALKANQAILESTLDWLPR